MPDPPTHKPAICVGIKIFNEKTEEEYRAAFEKYANSSSQIEKDFRTTIKQLGVSMDNAYFKEKFSSWDIDQSVAITEDEFTKFCAEELDKCALHETDDFV